VITLKEFHADLVARGILPAGERFMQLEMDITSKCNLRCVMCYHSLDEFVNGKAVNVTADTFAAMASALLPHVHTLTLSLGSEPLMSPHFVRILRVAAPHRVPNLSFYTNGLLLTDAIADAIVQCGVTKVCISVDGARRATYEAIRRGASFRTLLRNIRNLVARRDALRSPTPALRFDVVIMRRNVEELEDIVVLGAKLGISAINFFHMVAYEGLAMESESMVHDKERSNYWVARATNAAERLGIAVTAAPRPFQTAPLIQIQRPGIPPQVFSQTPYCRYPFFHVSMNSGGHVLACPHANGEPAFGTVSAETPIEAIWLGPKFTELRERILAHDPPAMCRRCSFLTTTHPDAAELFATRPH
jgi:MoaA/NifB/PqqE/SkfB family radical SAM enzyme